MCEADFVHECMSILGLLATIAIIMTALGTILGLVKPANALKYCGVFVGLTIVTVLFVSVLVGLWSSMSLWRRIILTAIGFSVWRLRKERRQPRRKREEE